MADQTRQEIEIQHSNMKKRNVKFVDKLNVLFTDTAQQARNAVQIPNIVHVQYALQLPVAFKGSSSQSILKLEPSEMSEEIQSAYKSQP